MDDFYPTRLKERESMPLRIHTFGNLLFALWGSVFNALFTPSTTSCRIFVRSSFSLHNHLAWKLSTNLINLKGPFSLSPTLVWETFGLDYPLSCFFKVTLFASHTLETRRISKPHKKDAIFHRYFLYVERNLEPCETTYFHFKLPFVIQKKHLIK